MINGITQTRFFGDPRGGNCGEAACATLLGLTLDQVPDFRRSYTIDDEETPAQVKMYWDAFVHLFWTRGFRITRADANFVPECMYLASGPSSRGCGHMVVYYDGKLVWDPHPSREGIREVEHIWFALPIDPAAFKMHDRPRIG